MLMQVQVEAAAGLDTTLALAEGEAVVAMTRAMTATTRAVTAAATAPATGARPVAGAAATATTGAGAAVSDLEVWHHCSIPPCWRSHP